MTNGVSFILLPPSYLKLPIQTVLHWDILLQLFSLMSVAALHSFLIGCQGGQSPRDRNQVWRLWTHTEVTGGPGCGQAVCSLSCSEF